MTRLPALIAAVAMLAAGRDAGPGTVLVRGALLALVILLSGFSGLDAQTYRGTVVEAGSGQPISGAILRGSPGNYVEVTLEDGVFTFVVPPVHQPLEVVVSRQGYVTETFTFEERSRELVLELTIAPIELEGISTEVTFERRIEELEEALDERYAPHRGVFRSVGRDVIRTFDEKHESDEYAMITGALDLHWDFDAPDDVLRRRWGGVRGRMQFEVFIDDVRVPLQTVVNVPNEELCRAEMFHRVPVLTSDPLREPSPQLRVYTCSFMGRVAAGLEEIEDRVCWNELVAWRTPTSLPSGCTYRGKRDQEPHGRTMQPRR